MASACKRLGCGKDFDTGNNADESACCYHPGPPIFHDGVQKWGCCGVSGQDFDHWKSIPGCAHGVHSTVDAMKPKLSARESAGQAEDEEEPGASDKVSKEDCPRCRNGMPCNDHGATVNEAGTVIVDQPEKKKLVRTTPVTPATPRKCLHSGCGAVYKEEDNTDTACSYHPGAPDFHDGAKGWPCCQKYFADFGDFMAVAPCTTGRHEPDEDWDETTAPAAAQAVVRYIDFPAVAFSDGKNVATVYLDLDGIGAAHEAVEGGVVVSTFVGSPGSVEVSVLNFARTKANYRFVVPDLSGDVNTEKCAITVKADQIKVKLSKVEKGVEWEKLSKAGKY